MNKFQVGALYTMTTAEGQVPYRITELVTAPRSTKLIGLWFGRADGLVKPRYFTLSHFTNLIATGTVTQVESDPVNLAIEGDAIRGRLSSQSPQEELQGKLDQAAVQASTAMEHKYALCECGHVLSGHADEGRCMERFCLCKTPRPLRDRKAFDFQVGDRFMAGEEMVRILDINREHYFMERQFGVPVRFSKAYVFAQLKAGHWTALTDSQQLAELEKEADRLDTAMAELFERRSAVVARINALRGQADTPAHNG